MKKTILLFCYLTATICSTGQTPEGFYKKADSLYRLKDYKGAAMSYSDGIKMEGDKTELRTYRAASRSYSLANMPDPAFELFDIMASLPTVSKIDAQQFEYGNDYENLRSDKRWKPVFEKIQARVEKNSFPQEEFVYGRKDGMGLTLVLIKPKVKSNGKAIVYVVSGSWVSSYNGIEISTEAAVQYLARGYSVFAVMHGSQPRYAIPDAINDIKRAVRYIRFNAAKFGIDPNHIGITGSSAGGHLSLAVATADDKPIMSSADPVDRVSSRVQAIAVLFPPTDLLNWGGPGFNFVNAKDILKTARTWGAVDFTVWNEKYRLYEEVTDTAARNKIGREISPEYFVTADDPPVFIIHGDADPTVPLQQSQSIITLFNQAGVPNKFIIKKGGKHNPYDMLPEWQQFVDWFDKYLN